MACAGAVSASSECPASRVSVWGQVIHACHHFSHVLCLVNGFVGACVRVCAEAELPKRRCSASFVLRDSGSSGEARVQLLGAPEMEAGWGVPIIKVAAEWTRRSGGVGVCQKNGNGPGGGACKRERLKDGAELGGWGMGASSPRGLWVWPGWGAGQQSNVLFTLHHPGVKDPPAAHALAVRAEATLCPHALGCEAVGTGIRVAMPPRRKQFPKHQIKLKSNPPPPPRPPTLGSLRLWQSPTAEPQTQLILSLRVRSATTVICGIIAALGQL